MTPEQSPPAPEDERAGDHHEREPKKTPEEASALPAVPTSVRAAAEQYLAEGLEPIPIATRSKRPPKGWSWSKRKVTTKEEIAAHFRDDGNVAIALGRRSAGLCDIDLDWPEAAQVADLLCVGMPAFGRVGNPRSHRLFICPEPGKRVEFKLANAASIGAGREMVVELRGDGHYTVFPPSTHECGEQIEFTPGTSELPELEWDKATRLCGLIAFLAVTLKCYPRLAGDRDNICLALTGALLRFGLDAEETDRVVGGIARLASDEEAGKRGTKGAASAAKLSNGEPCWGLPELCTRLGIPPMEESIRNWLQPEGAAASSATIMVANGKLLQIVRQAEDALIASGKPIFQRGEELVRPIALDASQLANGIRRRRGAVVLFPINECWLTGAFAGSATWLAWMFGKIGPIDPPSRYAAHLLAQVGDWRFPVLRGVITAPTLRADGSVLQLPGYDEASQLLFDPCGVEFPKVPDAPAKEDARAAIDSLAALFVHFPFVDEHARGVALSAVLTGLICRILPATPLHAFDAPTAGTGKSLLAETVGVIVTGGKPPAMSQGKNAEENEKRLSTVLRAGDQIILIDNVERPVQGDFLCSMLTQECVQARILGKSERVVMPSNVLVMVTGNNLELAGDVSRRVVMCRMDSGRERPDRREFPFSPVDIAREQRPQLVVAALTALRAYIAAGRPQPLPKMGSFEDWNIVRETLVWLGQGDPEKTRAAAFENDLHKSELVEILTTWHACFGDRPMDLIKVRQGCEATMGPSNPNSERLYRILVEGRLAHDWNPRSIGRRLHALKDRVAAGLVLRRVGDSAMGALWRVEPARGAEA